MGSILDTDSTVHPCPCRGQRGQETGSVILTSVSKWRKSEGTGPGIRWYFASIAAGKQGQTCQCVSNAGLTELDLLSLCTTTLKKIHHVGKQNTPLLQTSLRNSARPVHVTWQQPWLQFMFCLFSRLRGGFSFSIQQHYIFSNIFKQWPRHLPLLGQGPLVFLKYFHQDLIKWCSMHTLNLGLCYSTNGGALMLCDKDWFQNMLLFFCCPMFFFLVSLGVCDCFHGFSFDCFLGIFINFVFFLVSGWCWLRNPILQAIKMRTFKTFWT